MPPELAALRQAAQAGDSGRARPVTVHDRDGDGPIVR